MVNSWYIPGIFLVYSWYIPVSLVPLFHHRNGLRVHGHGSPIFRRPRHWAKLKAPKSRGPTSHRRRGSPFWHGSLNVRIEHHPTIRYIVYNGYYKVMSNIPKMGHLHHLPTPVWVGRQPKIPKNVYFSGNWIRQDFFFEHWKMWEEQYSQYIFRILQAPHAVGLHAGFQGYAKHIGVDSVDGFAASQPNGIRRIRSEMAFTFFWRDGCWIAEILVQMFFWSLDPQILPTKVLKRALRTAKRTWSSN